MVTKSPETIKVYLQYPWKFPDSPYYKYLIDTPPKNVSYLNVSNQRGVLTSGRKLFVSHNFKRAVRMIINFLRIPLLNAYHTKSRQSFDLIHCAHCLSLNKATPWVADFEGRWQFYLGHESAFLRRRARRLLVSKNCKKIIAWTNRVKAELVSEFPEIEDKIEVIYPAIPSPPAQNIKANTRKEITLLFAGRYFYRKGGLHALEAIDRLTKQNKHVKAIFISEVPDSILQKYSKNTKIEFHRLMSQKRLFEEIYPRSDILVYPGYRDSFGFGFLEALSYGIPIITLKGFARDELVKGGKEGVIIDIGREVTKPEMRMHSEGVVRRLVEETQKIIGDANLRKKMSVAAIAAVRTGRFSIKKRDAQYERVYADAVS